MKKICRATILIVILGITFFRSTDLSLAGYRDENPDFDGTLIDHDETWRKGEQYIFDKQVAIVDGAKLTIEPGVVVSFRREVGSEAIPFQIWDGVIEAVGTETEPIVFRREHDTDAFFLDFSNFNETQSLLKYVRFLDGGDSWFVDVCDDCQQSFFESFFVKRALAIQQRMGVETLKYGYGKLRIEDTVFVKSAFLDVSVWDSRINEDTDGSGNFLRWDPSFLSIVNSDFSGDATVPALRVQDDDCNFFASHCPRKITLENNWYGSSEGPNTNDTIVNPMSKYIYGTVNLNNFSATQFFCLEQCYSNIMFLPGLEASRLYLKEGSDENQLWEPNRNLDVEKLYLDENGKSKNNDIFVRGVLDEANIFPIGQVNIYKTFIHQMNVLKDTEHRINDWKPVAYDWRLSFDDILADGTIERELRSLAEHSKSGRVTIVAHSNGGLLTKALLKKLGDAETQALVDKIILVAVPQVGTPSALAGMLHGEKQNIFPVLDTQTARGLGENMPGAYQVLPSERYFDTVQIPVATFDTTASADWKDRYSDPISSRAQLHDFLSDRYGKMVATDAYTDIPSQLNVDLLNNAEAVHDTLDTWVAPNGVTMIQIAGWGVPATLSSIAYDTRKVCGASECSSSIDILHPNFEFTLDGDGTVVLPSALYMGGAERYWVDMKKFDTNHRIATGFGLFGPEHKDILEIPELNSFIVDTVVDDVQPLDQYQYLSTEVPPSDDTRRLQYSLQSPLTLDLYDIEGRHTGITPEGVIEERIPGTYYRQFGDMKYIFADESTSMHIVMHGYDTGTFTFSVKELRGDSVLGTVTFKDMPTTPQTEVSFDVPSDLGSASSLRIDVNGDEHIDYQLEPKRDEVVTLEEKDSIPPVTTASISGIEGKNNWYISDVAVTLAAIDTDHGSGIKKTEYSLDNGITWHIYTETLLFSQEGITSLQYFSTDKQGNQETVEIKTIHIDKTAPESRIGFNITTQKLDITGVDNLSDVSVLLTETSEMHMDNKKFQNMKPWFSLWFKKKSKNLPDMLAILTDEAGHVTSLAFEKTKDRNGFVSIHLWSIGYDGVETLLSDVSAQYKWRVNKKNQYQLLASHLRTRSSQLESHYLLKKNETWIMERPNELRDDDFDDESERRPIFKKLPGIVVPSMETRQGRVYVRY